MLKYSCSWYVRTRASCQHQYYIKIGEEKLNALTFLCWIISKERYIQVFLYYGSLYPRMNGGAWNRYDVENVVKTDTVRAEDWHWAVHSLDCGFRKVQKVKKPGWTQRDTKFFAHLSISHNPSIMVQLASAMSATH